MRGRRLFSPLTEIVDILLVAVLLTIYAEKPYQIGRSFVGSSTSSSNHCWKKLDMNSCLKRERHDCSLESLSRPL